jgi:hypothetical protein
VPCSFRFTKHEEFLTNFSRTGFRGDFVIISVTPVRQQRLFLERGTNVYRSNSGYFYILYIKMTLIQWSVFCISRTNVGRYHPASLEGSVVTAVLLLHAT